MRNIVLAIVLLFSTAAVPGLAQPPGPHSSEFGAFHLKFQQAAKANDKQKLVDMIAFPVADWSVERKDDVQTEAIKDRADFLKRYDLLFNASMRSHVATAKAEPLQDDRWMISWHDANAEFSFEFEYRAGTGYRVTSYSIGPL